MMGDKAAEPGSPRTLWQAREALTRSEPRLKAPLSEWLAYYQRAAALYAEIAEIDRGHHHTLHRHRSPRGHHSHDRPRCSTAFRLTLPNSPL